jgi:hypothetical protein
MDDIEVRAFVDGARDAVRKMLADVRSEADRAEALRAAEHRAFMAESRQADLIRDRDFADMMRELKDRLASVKDGAAGRDGIDGKDGAPGRDGVNGADGAPGQDGMTGERGADGAPGIDGKDGANGEPGIAGQPGSDGIDGKDGADGQPGRDGVDGKDGSPGAAGEPGRDGVDGKDGAEGAPGRDGADGVDGPVGSPGRDGVDGKDGADGAPGRDGDQGPQGVPGADGRDGIDGKDAYQGEARGLFDPEAQYRAMDTVSFNGSEWRAKRDDPGALPGDGWMLSAGRGKRGDRGDRGERGAEGAPGRAAPEIIALYADPKAMSIVATKDDGSELTADLFELAQVIRTA